ncbi:hypothetical protein UlMin_033098 [Ulmus minor]
MEEHLLSERKKKLEEKESKKWSLYQYEGRTGSVILTISSPETKVSITEIQSANVFSDAYPPLNHAEQAIVYQAGYGGDYGGTSIEHKGPELGVWVLDLRSQFPVLFVPYKETRTKIPHSEIIKKCSDCTGRGNILCSTCNVNQEPRFYKENQMTQCFGCYGKLPCATYGSWGLITCGTCHAIDTFVLFSFLAFWAQLHVIRSFYSIILAH